MIKSTLLLALITLSLSVPPQAPIIGIYTQWDNTDQPELSQLHRKKAPQTDKIQTYIAASYLKFVQMAGANAVPLYAYSDKAYFDDILPKLNGVLFPGGGEEMNISQKWTQNADYILKYAIAENDAGRIYPVWGTCLGQQLLAYLTSGCDPQSLGNVRGDVAVTNTVKMTSQSASSYLFEGISQNMLYQMQNGNGILYFNHKQAITNKYFQSSTKLKSFWKITGTSNTLTYNDEFISILEAKKYPIYGVQFHPEKTLFEWKVFADRSYSPVFIIQNWANKFIQKARMNKNSFNSVDQFESLSFKNFIPRATNMSFTRIYVFDEVRMTEQLKLRKQE